MSKTWKIKIGYDAMTEDVRMSPRKKCNHCNRKASQWVRYSVILLENKNLAGKLYVVDWDSRCHQHRTRADKLPDNAQIASKEDVRIRWDELRIAEIMHE